MVDDVDQVSFGFSSFLADLARSLDATPLLIVCTAAGEPPGITDTLPMAPFDVATAERLVAARLGASGEEVAAAVVGALGTDPLALEQGMTLLVETSALSREAGGWALGADPLPPFGSVGDVLDARVRALPADVRATAAVAALMGTTVPASPLLASDDEGTLARISSGSSLSWSPRASSWPTGWRPRRPPAGTCDRCDRRVAGPRRRGPRPHRTGDAGRRGFATASFRRPAHASGRSPPAPRGRCGGRPGSRRCARPAERCRRARRGGRRRQAAPRILERRMASLLEKDDPVRAELLFRAASREVETGRVREAEAAINAALTATVGVPGVGSITTSGYSGHRCARRSTEPRWTARE